MFQKQTIEGSMKKIYIGIIALITSTMMTVSAMAVDIIVVSHGQENDPFW